MFKEFKFEKNDCNIEAKNLENYNLIYGNNGVGKTSLSEAFHGKFNSKQNDTGLEINNKNTENDIKQTINVKVFNSHFANKVLGIIGEDEEQGLKKSNILIIGEDAQELTNDLKEYQNNLSKYENYKNNNHNAFNILEDAINKTIENLENKYTSWATGIRGSIGGVTTQSFPRNKLIQNIEAKEYKLLEKENYKDKKAILEKSTDIKKIALNNKTLQEINFNESKNILQKRIEKQDAIKGYESILYDWVRNGFKLHENKADKNCGFCGNKITDKRMKDIEKMLLNTESNFKNSINKNIKILKYYNNSLKNIISSIFGIKSIGDEFEKTDVQNQFLYPRNQEQYEGELDKVISNYYTHSANINTLIKALEDKHNYLYDNKTYDINAICVSNEVINKNLLLLYEIAKKDDNSKNDVKNKQDEALLLLKKHYIAKLINGEEYKKEKKKVIKNIIDAVEKYNNELTEDNDLKITEELPEKIEQDENELYTQLKDYKEKIEKKRKEQLNTKITNIKNHIKKKNDEIKEKKQDLKQFNEYMNNAFNGKFTIEDSEEEGKYIVKRKNGEQVKDLFKDLSEGEKSLIAFIYFLLHINSSKDNQNNNIVCIIDDPATSLDANRKNFILYKITELLYKENIVQLFVFTHYFSFANAIANAFKKAKDTSKKALYFEMTLKKLELKTENYFNDEHVTTFYHMYKYINTKETEYDDGLYNALRVWLETYIKRSDPNMTVGSFIKQYPNKAEYQKLINLHVIHHNYITKEQQTYENLSQDINNIFNMLKSHNKNYYDKYKSYCKTVK